MKSYTVIHGNAPPLDLSVVRAGLAGLDVADVRVRTQPSKAADRTVSACVVEFRASEPVAARAHERLRAVFAEAAPGRDHELSPLMAFDMGAEPS